MIRVVIFDWGDTVMRDFPQYSGAMATWPRVEAMPGIKAALAALKPHYRLALATNAGVSDPAHVRAALRRLGLDAYFDPVLTARQLGVSKPDPAFFDAVLARCECMPYQAVMVGDVFRTDVEGAKKAGLWAIWYNPGGHHSPAESAIAADAELRDFSELAGAIAALEAPDRASPAR